MIRPSPCFSGQAGQRFDGLKALAEAARIARTLDVGDEEILQLRNDAIACLALADLRFQRRAGVPDDFAWAFDPEFEHIAWGDRQGNIHICRVADWRETARIAGPNAAASDANPSGMGLQYSPDGQWLYVHYDGPGRPREVKAWEIREGKPVRKIAPPYFGGFSPDGRLNSGGRPDGSVSICDVSSGQEVKRLNPALAVTGVKFHPTARELAVSVKSDNRLIVVIDMDTEKEVARYPHPERVAGVAWRGDGRLLAVACADQRIYVWDTVHRWIQSVLEAGGTPDHQRPIQPRRRLFDFVLVGGRPVPAMDHALMGPCERPTTGVRRRPFCGLES